MPYASVHTLDADLTGNSEDEVFDDEQGEEEIGSL
jgi:hypothetical protein